MGKREQMLERHLIRNIQELVEKHFLIEETPDTNKINYKNLTNF